MKTIFFGSSKYVLPTIEMLNTNFELGLIVTTEKDATGAVPSYAIKNNIPFLFVSNVKEEDVLEKIKSIGAEVGVLGYFGRIVPQELLSIFPKGIINIHPSLLPKYRGPTPVQTAILSGDEETGTTIILLDKEVDHGPMLTQQQVIISADDTTDSLHEKLFTLGATLIKDVLPGYINGQLRPVEQDHDSASYTKHLSRIDGQIDIYSPPDKDKLDRMIRAYYPWPNVWTRLRLGSDGQAREKMVKFLPGKKIQVEGGKPMSIKDFTNGYPEAGEVIKNLFG